MIKQAMSYALTPYFAMPCQRLLERWTNLGGEEMSYRLRMAIILATCIMLLQPVVTGAKVLRL
jgi:hypothetical protein